MANWNEHVLNVRARLDKASKQEMIDSVRGVFTEGANIDFNSKENLRGLHDLADVMRKIFSAAGNTTIDFTEMIKLPGPELFNGLKEAAKDFESVWNSVIANMGSFSLKDIFMEDASGISMAMDRISKNGKVIEKDAKRIMAAFEPVKSKNINKLLKDATELETVFTNSSSWEERTTAALKYLNVYERIAQIEDDIDVRDIDREFAKTYKNITNKDYKLGGLYSIDSLKSAIPQMQTSLQNIFNMALGKPLLGLLEGGRINLEFAPVVIKKLDVGDLFDKKGEKGTIGIPVAPEIDPGFQEKLSKLWELAQAKSAAKGTSGFKAAYSQYNEQFNEILNMFPEDKLNAVEARLERFTNLKNLTDQTLGTAWKDFSKLGLSLGGGDGSGGGFGFGMGEGTGSGDGDGSGDTSSAELANLKKQLADKESELASLREEFEATQRSINAYDTQLNAERDDRIAAEQREAALIAEIEVLRQQIANMPAGGAGGGDGAGITPEDVENANKLADTVQRVEAAYKELDALNADPFELKNEEEVNRILQERLAIIRRVGAENLKAYNQEAYEGVEYINDEYLRAIDSFRESKDDEIYNQLDENFGYDNEIIESSQTLEVLLAKRRELMQGIYFDAEQEYLEQEEINAAIERRIALMKELEPLVESGAISKDTMEEMVYERGDIELRRAQLESLLTDQFGNEPEDIDEAQALFDQYEKILVETGSGKKLTLGPEMSEEDWNKFTKCNIDAIKSIEFFRKAIQQENTELDNQKNIIKDVVDAKKNLKASQTKLGVTDGTDMLGESTLDAVKEKQKTLKAYLQELIKIGEQEKNNGELTESENERKRELLGLIRELGLAVRYKDGSFYDTRDLDGYGSELTEQIEQLNQIVSLRKQIALGYYDTETYGGIADTFSGEGVSDLIWMGASSASDIIEFDKSIVGQLAREYQFLHGEMLRCMLVGEEVPQSTLDRLRWFETVDSSQIESIIPRVEELQQQINELQNSGEYHDISSGKLEQDDAYYDEKIQKIQTLIALQTEYMSIGGPSQANTIGSFSIDHSNEQLQDSIGFLQKLKQGSHDVARLKSELQSMFSDIDVSADRYKSAFQRLASGDGDYDHTLSQIIKSYNAIPREKLEEDVSASINALKQLDTFKWDKTTDDAYYEILKGIRDGTFTTVDECIGKFKELSGIKDMTMTGPGGTGADINVGAEGAGTSAHTTEKLTIEEIQNLGKIREEVNKITGAVKEKTQEFLNEQTAVKKAAQSEVHALGEVEKKVNAIRVALSNVNTLLNNIKKGKDVGSGLSNININVNHKKDEKKSEAVSINKEQLKSALQEITYKVKIAHDDNDKNANKVAINAADLESVLRRVFNPTTGIDAEQPSTAIATGIDVNGVKAETDVLIEQYRGILRTIEEWKTLYAQLKTIEASGTTDFRKQMLPMLENMSPELVKMVGTSFAEDFANGFKGVKTKDIVSRLQYIVGADLLGSVTDQVDMLGKIDFSKFSFDGLEIKETNIEFLREAFELLQKIDEKKKEIAGVSETALADGVESEQPKESYALDKTLLDVKKVLDKIAQNTASLNGVEIQRAVEANTSATEQVAPAVATEVNGATSKQKLDKTIERRKFVADGDDIVEVPDSRTRISSKKTKSAYQTKKTHSRIYYDESGNGQEVPTLVEIINDYDKIRKENDKTTRSVERAQKKVSEFIAKFQSKTGGNAQFIEGFGELDGFKVTADNIDAVYNKMIMLQQKYAELEKNFRKGQSSLNPFVNAINKSQNISNIFGEVEAKFSGLTVKSEGLISNFDKLNGLRKDIEGYTSKMLDGTMDYAEFEKFSVAMGEFTSTKTKVDGLIRSEVMNSKNLVKDYEELGRLRAKFEGSGDLEDREELRILAEKVAAKRESMRLTSEEIALLRQKSDEAYKEEIRLVNAAKQQEAINQAEKESEKTRKDAEKAKTTHNAQVEAEIVRELIGLYEQLGRAKAKGEDEEASRLRDVIGAERDKLSSVDYATDMKFKHAKDNGFNAARLEIENSELKDREDAIRRLNKLYREYGALLGQISAIDNDSHLAEQLNTEAEAKWSQIKSFKQSLGDIAPDVEKQFSDSAMEGWKKEEYAHLRKSAKRDDADEVARLKKIEGLNREIGQLRAKIDNTSNEGIKNALEEEISLREHLIDLQKEGLAMDAQEEAYEKQRRADRTKQAEKQAEDERKARADLFKEQAKADKKAAADEKRWKKSQAMTGKAGGAISRAESTWLEAEGLGLDGLPDDFKNKVKEQYEALQELSAQKHKVMTAPEVSDDMVNNLIAQTKTVNILTDEVRDLVVEYQKLSGANVDESKSRATSLTNKSALSEYKTQMQQYVKEITNGQGQIKGFNAETKTLTYTVKTGKNEFTEYTVAVRNLDHQLVAVQGSTKRTETFIEATTRKMKELTSYFSGMAIFNRIGQELRRGIQYVREIDLALTELKKVTDETEEEYDQFLQTAAKTGSRLGTTISAVTEATATFAKLGYTMEQATEMAESAIVYKNVGDNIASTGDAADSIISTMKGFRLEASESMAIVDRFNEVGNRFAITSQGIGEALRLSASALSEGGNSLDESIALITAANEVVNDPSSVGTALKTLTLRLRGSKTELEEMGEDVSDMATTTSQLQAKLLALTGGQVDIMLDANTFKNSTQILREMAEAWEDMNDIQRASALELMGGKRQAMFCPSVQKCA